MSTVRWYELQREFVDNKTQYIFVFSWGQSKHCPTVVHRSEMQENVVLERTYRSHHDKCAGQGVLWLFLNRRAAARYRALASIIPGYERPEQTSVCYKISLVKLITNLNVILYLSTCNTVHVSVLTLCGNKMPTTCNRWFLLQIILLAQHVSGTTMPIIRSWRLLYKWLLPVVFAPNTTGSNHLYNTLELLIMGIVVSETCWASNKICNKNYLLHIVGILFPHINDDAWSKPHQICTNTLYDYAIINY